MKKYTQKEILNEGFWKGVGKTIGGVARGADYVLGKVAPEAQSLYKDPYKAVMGLKDAVLNKKSVPYKNQISNNVLSNIYRNVRGANPNYNVLNAPPVSFIGMSISNPNRKLYKVPVLDSTTNKKFYINVGEDGIQ